MQAAEEPHRHWPDGLQLSAFPAGHAIHALPPVPQVVSEGLLQLLPWQQPPGHVVPSHTQTPPRHSEPALHAGPEPQPQPVAVHVSEDDEEQL